MTVLPDHSVVVLNNWPMFGNPCSTHELYDIIADPWELENLANDPSHEDAFLNLDMELNKLMENSRDPALHGSVPSRTDEPVKPQWAKGKERTEDTGWTTNWNGKRRKDRFNRRL